MHPNQHIFSNFSILNGL